MKSTHSCKSNLIPCLFFSLSDLTGLVALDNLEVGELILAEYPIVCCETADPSFIGIQLFCSLSFRLFDY
jgi:hypothetical protein